jgi:DNA-binding NtrC family response regulator
VAAKQHVLVVDDDPSVGATVSRLIRAAGYEPHYVNTAAAALRRIESEPTRFLAVLSDLHMDSMDGLSLARQISEQWPRLPVILCSGDSGPGPGALEGRRGVAAVLNKPIRLQHIVDLLLSFGKD